MLGNYGAHTCGYRHMADVGRNFGEEGQARQAEQAELPFFPDGAVKAEEPGVQTKSLDAIGSSPFLAEIEARLTSGGDMPLEDRPLSEWVAWARNRIEALDPFDEGVAGMFGTIAKVTQWS